LTNFWQDVAIDREKGRIYIPLEDFDRFGYTETDLAGGMVDHRFRALMEFEVMRTRELFSRGSPLVDECPRELRLELSLTLRGGRAILDKIASQQFDVLACRPSLSRFEMIMLAGRSLVKRIP
jgi:phytoene/squalene synthetase